MHFLVRFEWQNRYKSQKVTIFFGSIFWSIFWHGQHAIPIGDGGASEGGANRLQLKLTWEASGGEVRGKTWTPVDREGRAHCLRFAHPAEADKCEAARCVSAQPCSVRTNEVGEAMYCTNHCGTVCEAAWCTK